MRSVLFLCIAASVHAFTTGISGYSGKDGQVCGACHSGGTAAPTATLNGPASLRAGTTAEYQLVIDTDVNSSASAKRAAGIDVAASAGSLATVEQENQTRLLAGEISHTNALPQSKILAISFALTAPEDVGGVVTLFGAALSADGTGTPSGDNVATTTLQVKVVDPNADLAGVDAVSGASPHQVTGDDMGPPRDEARWSCGSYVGVPIPVAGAPILLVLLLVVVLRRRV